MIVLATPIHGKKRIPKWLFQQIWEKFMQGKTQFSPSGFTAAAIANEATKRGVQFILRFHPKFKIYTIRRKVRK